MHELVLYYMRERVDSKNIDIKYIVATNIYEWFIIDASYFDRIFYGNKKFVKQYEEWRDGKKVTKDTSLFYNEIAKPFIDQLNEEIQATYFNIKEYEEILTNESKADDKDLIALFKLLSPSHLLRVSFANDSNELNSRFYKELLHIIGLEEVKDGGKLVINRKTKDVSEGSMIENTINILKTEDVLIRLRNKQQFGDNKDEQLYNLALELNLTWINRILFLKLLEGQLLSYHKNDTKFKFLNKDVVFDYDEIYKLFHQVLAKTKKERSGSIAQKYQWVPYLNSSLFEISELENQTIKINSLDDHTHLDILNGSVLSYPKGTTLNPLQYLFEFLDAYDFASEGVEEVQEDNRTLINASILGKIFEKINGYKDGSIYTPGFITMYMCREAIRRAVVQKFKDAYGWNINEFDDIKNYIVDRRSKAELLEFNKLINSTHVCDPAVGSGHFLVSGLNEFILIKHELGIFCDGEGSRISDYDITIENDELIVAYANGGDIFEYQIVNGKPKSKEDQRLQKTLFHEKQTIIENCLFGVDINPNSVKICRLRLWIELLKNAYYIEDSGYTELETLPNIDINIKCGNSLISRFGLDEDLGTALKSIKYDIKTYRGFVQDYKKCKDREAKRGIEEIINAIKNDFRTEIGKKDKDLLKLSALSGELFNLVNQKTMFETDKEQKVKNERIQKLESEINVLSEKIEEIKNNAIYRDAFEWRFEFPEVLNDNGDYKGFDVVVGNPPYIKEYEGKEIFDGLRMNEVYQGKMDIWYMFACDGLKLLKTNGYLNFIAPNNWTTNSGASKMRNYIIQNAKILQLIDFNTYMVFSNASIQTMIMLFQNSKANDYKFDLRKIISKKPLYEDSVAILNKILIPSIEYFEPTVNVTQYIDKNLTFNDELNEKILNKIQSKQNYFLDEYNEVAQGIVFPQDFVNKASNHKMSNQFKVGDGIFVLSDEEIKNLKLTDIEKQDLIKPYYTSEQFSRFYGAHENKYWVIYTHSKFKNNTEILPYPNIKKHLDNFKEVITSDNKPYGLHRSRVEKYFIGEKIIVQRKCPNKPIFTYTNFDTYVSATFYIIKPEKPISKFLTGIFNSKLIEFWLKNKGKMQGSNFQIDKEPLLQIPINLPQEIIITKVQEIVSNIISLKKQDQDTTALEAEIDQMVYELYGLTEDEIKVVEGV